MKIVRWLEALCGALVLVIGAWNIAHLLANPAAYRGEECQISSPSDPAICTTTHASFLQVNGTMGIVDLCIIAVLLLGVAGAAILHAWRGSHGARVTLWLLTAALVVYTVLTILSIGPLLLPSAALALIASLAAIGNRPARA
jgi:hypothetical protein